MMKKEQLLLGIGAVVVAAVLAACGATDAGLTGPTGLSVGPQASIADLPPTTANSCPSDAPTMFTVKADGPVNGKWRLSFDWRRTGATNTYNLQVYRRVQVGTRIVPVLVIDAGSVQPTDPPRYVDPGVYDSRVAGNCGPDSKWTGLVTTGAGSPSGPDPNYGCAQLGTCSEPPIEIPELPESPSCSVETHVPCDE